MSPQGNINSENLIPYAKLFQLLITTVFLVNAPLCGIKNITEYREYIILMFGYILSQLYSFFF